MFNINETEPCQFDNDGFFMKIEKVLYELIHFFNCLVKCFILKKSVL